MKEVLSDEGFIPDSSVQPRLGLVCCMSFRVSFCSCVFQPF